MADFGLFMTRLLAPIGNFEGPTRLRRRATRVKRAGFATSDLRDPSAMLGHADPEMVRRAYTVWRPNLPGRRRPDRGGGDGDR